MKLTRVTGVGLRDGVDSESSDGGDSEVVLFGERSHDERKGGLEEERRNVKVEREMGERTRGQRQLQLVLSTR